MEEQKDINQKDRQEPMSVEGTKSENSLEMPLPPVHGGETDTPMENHIDQTMDITVNTMESSIESNFPSVYEQDVSTLLELPLDYSSNLMYYYPYFFKTHLISIGGELDLTTLVTDCLTPGCNYCSSLGVCMRCSAGFILMGDSCVLFCPDGFIADTLRMTCVSYESIF